MAPQGSAPPAIAASGSAFVSGLVRTTCPPNGGVYELPQILPFPPPAAGNYSLWVYYPGDAAPKLAYPTFQFEAGKLVSLSVALPQATAASKCSYEASGSTSTTCGASGFVLLTCGGDIPSPGGGCIGPKATPGQGAGAQWCCK